MHGFLPCSLPQASPHPFGQEPDFTVRTESPSLYLQQRQWVGGGAQPGVQPQAPGIPPALPSTTSAFVCPSSKSSDLLPFYCRSPGRPPTPREALPHKPGTPKARLKHAAPSLKQGSPAAIHPFSSEAPRLLHCLHTGIFQGFPSSQHGGSPSTCPGFREAPQPLSWGSVPPASSPAKAPNPLGRSRALRRRVPSPSEPVLCPSHGHAGREGPALGPDVGLLLARGLGAARGGQRGHVRAFAKGSGPQSWAPAGPVRLRGSTVGGHGGSRPGLHLGQAPPARLAGVSAGSRPGPSFDVPLRSCWRGGEGARPLLPPFGLRTTVTPETPLHPLPGAPSLPPTWVAAWRAGAPRLGPRLPSPPPAAIPWGSGEPGDGETALIKSSCQVIGCDLCPPQTRASGSCLTLRCPPNP